MKKYFLNKVRAITITIPITLVEKRIPPYVASLEIS